MFNPPDNSTYIKKQVAQKFKENALEGDYETKEDLKEVAKLMKNLIDDTLIPIESCIRIFNRDHETQIKEWKDKLRT